MAFIIFLIITFILFKSTLDWGVFNTCLILMFCFSVSELFKNLIMTFNEFLNNNTLEKALDLKIKLEEHRLNLLRWSDSLKDATKETTILQLKSMYVLLTYTIKNNDKKNFNLIVKKLKLMKVPDEYLIGPKKFEDFIKDVDDGKYDVEFDKELCHPYFVLKK